MMKKIIKIGALKIGGGNPVAVQGMVKTPPSDKKTVSLINAMTRAGCRMARIAVPNMREAGFLADVVKKIKIPLIADIHFDWRLAIAASVAGASKIRINPSNIGSARKVADVAASCKDKKIPIRVGANSGSVKTLSHGDKPKTKARKLFNAVSREVATLEKTGFYDIVVSAKAEDVETTIEVNQLLAKLGYPVHIGVTATGAESDGIVKSSIALGSLLREGIGDTIRVSLLAGPVAEINAAYSILAAVGLHKKKINFIACPTCGRCGVDLKSILEKISSRFPDALSGASPASGKTLNVAIMGCEVNGPGEARNADIGLAFTGRKAIYFEKGRIIKTLDRKDSIAFLTGKIKKCLTLNNADC